MSKITFLKTMMFAVIMLTGSMSVLGQYSGSGTFNKITSLTDLTNGYYVIVNSADAMAMSNTNAGSYFGNTAVTPVSGVLTNPAASIVWKIETNGSGLSIYNEATSKYVSYTGSSNAAYAVDAVTTDNQRWSFTYASSVFTVTNLAVNTRILQYNASSPRFACYTSAQQKILLYKMAETSSCTTSSLAFASSPVEKLVTDAKFTITPTTNSTGAITYLSSVETVATVDPNTGEVTIVGAGSTEITANQVADATYCANSVKYTLNVASSAPTITITEVTVPAFLAQVGQADNETINVGGANLTSDIILTIDGADAALFSVNSPLSSTGGVATIIYTPASAGTHSATLRINSTGAAEVIRALSGTAYVSSGVIISEVFGGGGNSGATLKNDFIELYNTTADAITIGGWSVQYFSAAVTGEASNVFVIPEGRFIPSGAHFLIKASAGAGGTQEITDQDATSTLQLGGTAGKIILYNTSAAQTISDISSIIGNPNFVDYVPYGTTAVPVWGTAMSSNISSTTSATRNTVAPAAIGAQRVNAAVNYMYSGNIGNDFSAVAPSPTSTGISTGLKPANQLGFVYASNGKIMFNAIANQTVEVFNAVGQLIVSRKTIEGLNTISVLQKGIVLVKVGDKVSKVIL